MIVICKMSENRKKDHGSHLAVVVRVSCCRRRRRSRRRCCRHRALSRVRRHARRRRAAAPAAWKGLAFSCFSPFHVTICSPAIHWQPGLRFAETAMFAKALKSMIFEFSFKIVPNLSINLTNILTCLLRVARARSVALRPSAFMESIESPNQSNH